MKKTKQKQPGRDKRGPMASRDTGVRSKPRKISAVRTLTNSLFAAFKAQARAVSGRDSSLVPNPES